ncbi:hypothetical protein [Agathobaculum sp.]|uniref:hypothetical protein n=1 Tax=Agathobaculum sp. TaxID=2048138 RepID=UPI003AF07805
MLKETLRKLMNLSLEEKPEGKITEVNIGNNTCSVWIMSKSANGTYQVDRRFYRHKSTGENVWYEGLEEVPEAEVIRAMEAVNNA